MADRRTLNRGRNETPLERADRNFLELLQELRVTQTGVQILFAFLLTLAFTQRFPSLDTTQRVTYVVTLLLAVLAAVIFTAPAALHRSLFQKNSKPVIVQVSSRLAGLGLAVLTLSLTGAVLLVVDVSLGRVEGALAATGTFLACAGFWALLPLLVRRARPALAHDDEPEDRSGPTAHSGQDEPAEPPERSDPPGRARTHRAGTRPQGRERS